MKLMPRNFADQLAKKAGKLIFCCRLTVRKDTAQAAADEGGLDATGQPFRHFREIIYGGRMENLQSGTSGFGGFFQFAGDFMCRESLQMQKDFFPFLCSDIQFSDITLHQS